MDGEVQNTSNRKFFTSVPAALFLLAAHANEYRSNVVYVNFAAVRHICLGPHVRSPSWLRVRALRRPRSNSSALSMCGGRLCVSMEMYVCVRARASVHVCSSLVFSSLSHARHAQSCATHSHAHTRLPTPPSSLAQFRIIVTTTTTQALPLIVAKFPGMHGVRIFGINSGPP